MSNLEREDEQPESVSPLELFYDLVFVGGVVVLAHRVGAGSSELAEAWVLTAAFALVMVWLATSLVFNRYPILGRPFDSAHSAIRVSLVFAQMAGVLICILALQPDSQLTAEIGLIAFGWVALTVAVMFILSRGSHPAASSHPRAPGILMFVAAALLFASSRFEDSRHTYIPILAAVVCLVLAVVFALSDNKALIRVAHLRERLALAMMILLGESFLGLIIGLLTTHNLPKPPLLVGAIIFPMVAFVMYFGPASSNTDRDPSLLPWVFAQLFLLFAIASTGAALANRAENLNRFVSSDSYVQLTIRFALLFIAMAVLSWVSRSRIRAIPWIYLCAAALVVAVGIAEIRFSIGQPFATLFELALFVIVVAITTTLGLIASHSEQRSASHA